MPHDTASPGRSAPTPLEAVWPEPARPGQGLSAGASAADRSADSGHRPDRLPATLPDTDRKLSAAPVTAADSGHRADGVPDNNPVSDRDLSAKPVTAADTPPPSGPPVTVPDIPSGPGERLLDELADLVSRYVALPTEHSLYAVTLWVAATHLQTAFQHAPRLAVVGPAKRCGKSRLLDVVTETVRRPVITVNATPAAIFRSINDKNPPTLLVDEADTLFGSVKVAEKNEELRGLLNAGHQRNRPSLRVVGPEQQVKQFPTFAMAALAGIGNLPDTIMDRAVVIRMRRRMAGEYVESFRSRRDTPELHKLRDKLASWTAKHRSDAENATPAMPVEDRAADTWEPLIVMADLAGGAWPRRAREACLAMTGAEQEADAESSDGVRILADCRRAFTVAGAPAALATEALLSALNLDAEAPWAESGRMGLTARGLGGLLAPYGISSSNIRFPDGRQRKGFQRLQFLDAWDRYCPKPATQP